MLVMVSHDSERLSMEDSQPAPPTTFGPIVLPARAAKIGRRGHPWFYRDDLADLELPVDALVRVHAPGGRDLGLGMTSARSKITLRLCGSWPGDGVPTPQEFLKTRLQSAVTLRGEANGEGFGVRLVHGESDAIPGLVIDRYASCCVVQSTSAFVESQLDTIAKWLIEEVKVSSVLLRGDVPVRKREGLPQEVRWLAGDPIESVEIEENGIRHLVYPVEGHKTGFYLDQRPARGRVKELSEGARVLDLFSYQGAFSLAALAGGAREVTAVDTSEVALSRATAAAQRQGLEPLQTMAGNVFDVVRELRQQEKQFDVIVLDPPPFCKSRRELEGGKRGYRDLNRIALRLLAPGGRLITASCSHHLRPEIFEEVLRQASFDLPFRVFLEERLGAGSDHPAWIRLPESEYLKVRILRRVDGGATVSPIDQTLQR